MKTRILISIILACFFLSVQADSQLPQKIKVFQPALLGNNIIKDTDLDVFLKKGESGDWGQNETTGKYWVVYSDRSKNTTYKEPSASESNKFGELGFNERVRIADIKNGFALVYDEPLRGTNPPAISTKAICKGWIPMKNLLLWQSCPVDGHGVYNKALIVINLEGLKGTQSTDLACRYENPITKDTRKKLVADPNFYFVMKKDDNGMVLLAKECKITTDSYAILYGWVNGYSFVPWSQRTCLEPNWLPDVVADLGGQKVDVRREGKKVTDILLGRKNNVTDNPVTKHRLEPQLMRYPLLSTGKEHHVTAFSRPDGQGHIPTVPVDADQTIIEIENDLLKDNNIINLIVVIDGTSSMEAFYKPIQEAIKSAYQTFGKDGKTVRVGVVIYRDYADGEYLTEKLTMRAPTDPAIEQFLSTGGQYGIKSSPKDRTNAEALYKGLEVALDAKTMGYDKRNSNLMFVVGDCGNDEADHHCLSQEEIIKRCAENRIQLMAFQVQNQNDPAYLNFRKQMNKIVKENLMAQYAFKVDKLKGEKAYMYELPDGYEYRTNRPVTKNYNIGALRNAGLGKKMEIMKLNELIKDSYEKFAAAIDGRTMVISNVEDVINDIDPTTNVASNSMEMGVLSGLLTEEQINAIKKNNSLMAFNGEVSIQSPNGHDYWQPIIYISDDEFQQLLERLKPVREAAAKGDRKPYVNAIKALIRSMVPDITEAEMDAKDVKEVMNLVAGLNVKTGLLSGYTLMQIQDENLVKKKDFDELITGFNSKYDKLTKINGNKYPFAVQRKGTWWYWIPAQDLP